MRDDGARDDAGRRDDARNEQTDEDRKTAASLLPGVSLPKGGGAIRGLGEKLSVNPATGACTLSLPLPLSAGRSDFMPKPQLSYDSGAGNGPLGFGWSLDIPAITRKTDKGLPRYLDHAESDVFVLAGAEDLVPVLDGAGARLILPPRRVNGVVYAISLYRPRIEGRFARIERWVAVDTGASHWRTLSRDNTVTLYGFDPDSRISDPADPLKVFSYKACRSWNDKGEAIAYTYVREDGAGVDRAAAHEANRTDDDRKSQTYLANVQYGNLSPYFPDWSTDGAAAAWPDEWLFTVAVDYGDHAAAAPTPNREQIWPVRPDPFSTYRAGFEVRTYRRAQRLLFFNNFPAEASAGADTLVRSLDLTYDDQQAPDDPRNPIYTFLTAITQTSYRRDGAAYLSRALPPLEFEYSRPRFNPEVLRLDPDSQANLPEGMGGSRQHWVDLDGEGLSGLLTETDGGWAYRRNLGADNRIDLGDGTLVARARFGPLETVAALPSASSLSSPHQLLSLNGDGRLDLVSFVEPEPGFFKRTADASFEPFRRFQGLPQLNWSDPNLKFVDLTGDGLADLLFTEDGLFTVYAGLGEAGFDDARQVRTPWDEEKGPKLVFSDGSETIFLADMSGDGLSDLVRVRNGEACYWPNLGYGRFGARVVMDRAPRFDSEERFDPMRIRLADIDGTGSADLLYIGADGVRAWFNQSGNAWSQATTLALFPDADRLSQVQVVDLMGVGVACLVWSSPLPAQGSAPLLYVDLMGGVKPHLLLKMRNNLGAENRLAYAPSTRFYLADRAAGQPWATRLPFPVQVVERMETFDWIGRTRTVSRYAYHHGYFDGLEREFRGFGRVDQWDTEELRTDTAFVDGEFVNWSRQSWSPPVLTRTWFHTGAFVEAGAVSLQYAHEYWIEPALRPAARAADAAAMRLPDTVLPPGLSPAEAREAYRALKGSALRIEVFDADTPDQPYTVTEQNFTVRPVQPLGGNRHAVFFVHPRESVSFHYERTGTDPRASHQVTLETGPYGEVRRQVEIGYPRRPGYAPPEPDQSTPTQSMLAYDQTRLHVRATASTHTAALDDLATAPDTYRAPQPASEDISELTGLKPSSKGTGVTDLFSFAELDTAWAGAWADIGYEAVPASDVNGAGAPPATPTRRRLKRTRTLYRADDLSGLLPLGHAGVLALPGETYRAALTPGQLGALFGSTVDASTLGEGGYVRLAGDTDWWAPSGRLFYSAGDTDTAAVELATARAHFFRPRRAVDPFGGISRSDHDGYDLLPAAVTDPVGNVTTAANDYRVLAPALVTDPNGARTAAAFDVRGEVTATAVMGKTTETVGDLLAGFVADLDDAAIAAALADPLADPASLLGQATTRTIYDVEAYFRTRANPQPSPPTAYALVRETHVSDLAVGASTRFQHRLTYSDGAAREIQRKTLAADGPLTEGGPTVSPRWIGSGWTIFNNKGKPVRTYEPYFSPTSRFEFAAAVGVSRIAFYDPVGRQVAELRPDNAWTKVVFDAWRTETWDADDTVKIADPRLDADVGDAFTRALGPAPGAFTSWRDLRIGGTYGSTPEIQAGEQDAAQKADAYAGTPKVEHLDALGRTCLAISDNGAAGRYPSRLALDTEGKPLAVFDALGRRAMETCLRQPLGGGGFAYVAGADMTGAQLYQISMDGGARRTFPDIAGQTIRRWDARGDGFRTLYDTARRVTHEYVSIGGASEILVRRTLYGEGLAAANLCGRLYRRYDEAGAAITLACDFKGNRRSTLRQLAADYHQSVDWTPLAALTKPADLDAAAKPLLSTGDLYQSAEMFDALNRPVQQLTPHNATMKPNVIQFGYDAAGLVATIDLWLQQASPPAGLLDPATADQRPLAGVRYNARGQRLETDIGNGSTTTYAYDPQTFRLRQLTTLRPGFPADQQTVQDLLYFYDPEGAVTRVRDDADLHDVIYFSNQRVEPSCDFTYDALHQLIAASGREHLGQTAGVLWAPNQVANDDGFRMGGLNPGDGLAMGTYSETYGYDLVGNLTSVAHQTTSGRWVRWYGYGAASQIDAGETGNRLAATSQPGDPAGGPYSDAYSYDAHGSMVQMPHLPALSWDERDRLQSSTRQSGKAVTPETTFYVYDAGDARVRKVTDRQAPLHTRGAAKTERIYLGAVEIYRELAADGVTVTLERETLRVAEDGQPLLLIETRTIDTLGDPAPAEMIRYQYANRLGSAVLELDQKAAVLTYEEYFPFGATAYQAVASVTNTPKRYRFTGKERDEESDLTYHGARYDAPWLGRWISVDPAGLADGDNLYRYARNNPVGLADPTGTQSAPAAKDPDPPAEADPPKAAEPQPYRFYRPFRIFPELHYDEYKPNAINLGGTNSAFQAANLIGTKSFEITTNLAGGSLTDQTLGRPFLGSMFFSERERYSATFEAGIQGGFNWTKPEHPVLPPGAPPPSTQYGGSLGFLLRFGPPALPEGGRGVGLGFYLTGQQTWGSSPPGSSGFNPGGNLLTALSFTVDKILSGIDLNLNLGGNQYASVNTLLSRNVLSPSLGVNLSWSVAGTDMNLEVLGGVNVGAGGSTQVGGPRTPISGTLFVGLGMQNNFLPRWLSGVEPYVSYEASQNVRTPVGGKDNYSIGVRVDLMSIDRPMRKR